MGHLIKIKKGLDLKIAGGIAEGTPVAEIRGNLYAVCPGDYPGFIPKVEVSEGDTVTRGQALFHDKNDERIKIVSPVAGTVEAIIRGERRRILRVVVRRSDCDKAAAIATDNISTREEAKNFLMRSGLWAMMRQRPYDIIPDPRNTPRDIFVTSFDSAPLAPDIIPEAPDAISKLEAAVKLLSALTSGNIYIGRRKGSKLPEIKGAVTIDFEGPHPTGNVGVQIANIRPVNKGETVWTLDITVLLRIGHAVTTGEFNSSTTVAVTGSETITPRLVKTSIGVALDAILKDNIKDDGIHHRIISGNVLTGIKETTGGFLRYPYRQITVIPEGDDINEFMGWASISPKKMSQSRSFPGHFLFKKLFTPDARLLGGRRALIMSGEYDRYLPMDILAEYLIKAILGRDIEKMEELGIYEIAPEDLALGEYADTSKLEAQKIVREGLDYLRKELE